MNRFSPEFTKTLIARAQHAQAHCGPLNVINAFVDNYVLMKRTWRTWPTGESLDWLLESEEGQQHTNTMAGHYYTTHDGKMYKK